MNAQQPVQPDVVADFAGAPPLAPLHMPKQILISEPGVWRRAFARIVTALPSGRRRPG
ncbi:hypothetical protein Q9295_15720 [Xinfangfangia sp. CPCC 101601]|uniref:Uncharacterized protein n=1 Tax=Pseudogemmobacter lacusdianii TaxID=3069608 RepID=A0ABU0W2Z7_9RHOB|nr:hypothetical protein [Xinfangfangia sp. CPCC 101601]MDQ2067825.1 hypothetical protein [Xinfangfangia sp. CPCC 101601]